MKRYLYQLLILVLIAFTFRLPVANLLSWLVVNDILSKITSSWLNDIIILIISALIFRLLNKQTDGRLLYKTSTVTSAFYLFNRFESIWLFTPTFLVAKISYIDIITAALVVPGIIKLISWIKTTFSEKHKTKKEDQKTENLAIGFLEDAAIDEISADTFQRSTTAKTITDKISLTKSKRSFAIGVIGEYGSGKTSFLNLIKYHLQTTENTQPPILIDFNPWTSDSPQEIHRSFFTLLIEKIGERDSKLSAQLHNYSRRLRQHDTFLDTVIKRLDLVNSLIENDTRSEFQKINDRIAELGQKVVVFVDDIDRLHPEEITEVLRLIRNTASFSNVFYIVGYDRNYVVEAIRKVNKKGYRSYLDKIFQLEIPLPKTEHGNLLTELKTKLNSILTEQHYVFLETRILPPYFESDYDGNIRQVFRNLRDIVKFVNSFALTYELIGKEAYFNDLFFNELLKFRYPAIYDLIYEKTDDFLRLHSYSYLYKEHYLLKQTKENENVYEITQHLIRRYSDYYSELDIKLIIKLLTSIYPDNTSHSRKIPPNSICDLAYFDVYYRNRLSTFDISENQFYRIKDEDAQNLYKFIDHCFNTNTHKQLLSRILKEDFSSNKAYFEKMVSAVFYMGPKYIEAQGKTSFPSDVLLPKIIDIQGTVINTVYKGNRQQYTDFLASLFNTATAPYIFQNEIIFKIKERYLNDFPISEEKLTELQVNYFASMSDSGHGLSEDVMWLFWGIRHKVKNPKSSNYFDGWTLDKTAIDTLKRRLIHKDASHFLKTTIQKPREPGFYMISKKILDEVFSSPEELRQAVTESNHTPDNVKGEYLGLFDVCKNVDFAEPVEYNFQTMLNPEEKKDSDLSGDNIATGI